MTTKAPAKNNPNGANQWVADPRQTLFLAYYLDPKSPTFSNALQSGIKAGFEREYAENIMSLMPDWLSEKLEKYKGAALLEKAERNLDEVLDLPSQVQAMGPFGPLFDKKVVSKKVKGKNGKTVTVREKVKVPIMVHAVGLLKVKVDASKFVAERVGKKKYGDNKEAPDNRVLIIQISNQSGTRYGANESTSPDRS